MGSVNLTPSQIRQLAEYSLFSPSARRAFVSPTPLLEALARMYVAQRELVGDTGIAIFRIREEALVWLGLTKAPLPL